MTQQAPVARRNRVVPQQISAWTAIGISVGVALVLLAGWTVMKAEGVLGWALVAALLAALVWPVRDVLDRHLPKVLATILGIILLIGVPVTLAALAFQDLSTQFDHLRTALVEASKNVEASGRFSDLAQRFHLTEQVDRLLERIDPTGGTVGQATSLVSALVVVIVLTIFLVADNGRIVRNGLRQIGDDMRRVRTAGVLALAYRRWSRYQLAMLAKGLVVGAIVFAGARLADLPAATVLAILAAALSTIPTVGTALGGIPLVLLAAGFREPWPSGAVAAILVLALQVADHVATRKVIEPRSMTVGPIVPVVVALVIGQEYGLGAAICTVGVATFVMAVIGAIGVSRRRGTAA